MKKKILTIILSTIFISILLSGCDSDDNECGMCNGSGYYQYKTCPACDGSGESDFDPYEIADDINSSDDDEDDSSGFGILIIGGIILYCIFGKKNK